MTESRLARFYRDVPDLEVIIDQLQEGGGGGDLSNYYTKTQVDGLIDGIDPIDVTASHYKGVWQSATAYAINDIVTHHEEGIYLITTAHTSGSVFNLSNKVRLNGRAGTYDVMDYGAVNDDTTDNTVALNTLIDLAVSDGISSGTYFARIYFPAGNYLVSGATTKGGETQGNAQIPLPVIPATGRKFSLILAGTENGTAFPHWEQTVAQKTGVVIRSSLTAQEIDGTWGPPSIIGGPTVDQGTGLFSNMFVTVDGITLMAPHAPSLMAWDFRLVAQVNIISGSALVNAGSAGTPNLSTSPVNSQSIGLRMPMNLNNDCSLITDFACEGFYYGVAIGEHFIATRLALIYCAVGVYLGGVGGSSYHGATIVNLSVEATPINIQCLNGDGGSFPLDILGMHTETTNTYNIDDPNGNFTGTIKWSNNGNSVPLVRGAQHLKIESNNQVSAPGVKSAPTLPASTVALVNPFWRDCAVSVAGGTVTEISIDGQATGLTTGTVIVPSGKTVALTYSSAPTWVWISL